MDVPGFDPSSMSDDELLSRHAELGRRLAWASRFSGSDMSYQINNMMIAIEMERRDRLLRFMFDQRQKMFPETIETEPDLAAANKKTEVADDSNDRMAQRRRVGRERAITKSSEPQVPHNHIQIPQRSAEPVAPPPEESKDDESDD
jgi:hypothetical protein